MKAIPSFRAFVSALVLSAGTATGQADLVITEISAPAGSHWVAGETQSVTITTRNAGNTPTPVSITSIHLADQTTAKLTNDMLACYLVPPLGNGDTYKTTVRFTNPRCWRDTTYKMYIGAYADGYQTIRETSETNNSLVIREPRPLKAYSGPGRFIEYIYPRANIAHGAWLPNRAQWIARNGVSIEICAKTDRHKGEWVLLVMSGNPLEFSFDPWSEVSLLSRFFSPFVVRTSETTGIARITQDVPKFTIPIGRWAFIYSAWFDKELRFTSFGDNVLDNRIWGDR